jgi:hypothetical protein
MILTRPQFHKRALAPFHLEAFPTLKIGFPLISRDGRNPKEGFYV